MENVLWRRCQLSMIPLIVPSRRELALLTSLLVFLLILVGILRSLLHSGRGRSHVRSGLSTAG
jgi:hypothetical protein